MSPLPSIEELLRRQRLYYEIVSAAQRRRAWGVIGINPANPTSRDSNHAYLEIALAPDRLAPVLGEVGEAYRAASLVPLLRFHIPPNIETLLKRAQALGWRLEDDDCFDETWRAWPVDRGHAEPPAVPGMTISVVRGAALEDLLVVHNDGVDETAAFRQRKVWSALCAYRGTDCILARIAGEPAGALACIWNGEWGAIENVQTRERFRRRGIATAMIRAAQRFAAERGAAGLYLYDTDEGPDRIYARAGFELVARVRAVALWLPAPSAPRAG